MSDQEEYQDPFAGAKSRPSVNLKDRPVGEEVILFVDGFPKTIQSKFAWPNGDPKKTTVFDVILDGEERSLWATEKGKLWKALGAARWEAGAVIEPGGVLKVTPMGENNYKAVYEPGLTLGDVQANLQEDLGAS